MTGKILNYTTEVPVEKTITEIERILQRNKVSTVIKEFKDGHISALFFEFDTGHGVRSVRLPANVDAVYTILVDGKRFFPIGIYYIPKSQEPFKELAEAGFNLVRCDSK